MSATNDKLGLPHWSKQSKGEKFLYIFIIWNVSTLIFTSIIYYNIDGAILHRALGFGIFCAGIIATIIYKGLEQK